MELEDFELKKERKLSEFVQDFINLLKLLIGHLPKVLFPILILPICGMTLLGYFISTQLNLNVNYSNAEMETIIVTFVGAFLAIIFIGLFAFGLAIEYFILIRDTKGLAFGTADIWHAFKRNFGHYFRFLLASILVTIILIVPVVIVLFISLFIPLVGTLLIGVVFAIIGLWFFSAFMLYREGYHDLMDSYTSAFAMLKSKLFEYGIASYIVTFIFQALMTLMTIMPAIIIALVAYNFIGFNDSFFDSYFGKILVTLGTSIVSVFYIIYFILSVLSYGIIYETAKELRYSENIFDRIAKIGGSNV